jgi:hypothetical protein
MLRKNPDAFALAAITFVMLAVTAARPPLRAPQPRLIVAPIRAEMLSHRQCIREEMQAHRDAVRQVVRQSVSDATRAIVQTLHCR